MPVILGKHLSSIYREPNRNGSGGVYTGNEAQVSTSAAYTHLYMETAKAPSLKKHFRQKYAKPRKRSGVKDRRGQIIGCVSIEERLKIVDGKSRAGEVSVGKSNGGQEEVDAEQGHRSHFQRNNRAGAEQPDPGQWQGIRGVSELIASPRKRYLFCASVPIVRTWA
jgi:IS30 family transposase